MAETTDYQAAIKVEYDVTPGELQTHDYPGSHPSIEVTRVFVVFDGKEIELPWQVGALINADKDFIKSEFADMAASDEAAKEKVEERRGSDE